MNNGHGDAKPDSPSCSRSRPLFGLCLAFASVYLRWRRGSRVDSYTCSSVLIIPSYLYQTLPTVRIYMGICSSKFEEMGVKDAGNDIQRHQKVAAIKMTLEDAKRRQVKEEKEKERAGLVKQDEEQRQRAKQKEADPLPELEPHPTLHHTTCSPNLHPTVCNQALLEPLPATLSCDALGTIVESAYKGLKILKPWLQARLVECILPILLLIHRQV